jgi:hypothetical protein
MTTVLGALRNALGRDQLDDVYDPLQWVSSDSTVNIEKASDRSFAMRNRPANAAAG